MKNFSGHTASYHLAHEIILCSVGVFQLEDDDISLVISLSLESGSWGRDTWVIINNNTNCTSASPIKPSTICAATAWCCSSCTIIHATHSTGRKRENTLLITENLIFQYHLPSHSFTALCSRFIEQTEEYNEQMFSQITQCVITIIIVFITHELRMDMNTCMSPLFFLSLIICNAYCMYTFLFRLCKNKSI